MIVDEFQLPLVRNLNLVLMKTSHVNKNCLYDTYLNFAPTRSTLKKARVSIFSRAAMNFFWVLL